MAGDRVRADEYAERVNAAADLVESGVPVADAARELAGQFGCSVRQARRYAERAAQSGRVVAPQAAPAFTDKLPAGLAGRGHHLRGRGAGAGGIPGPGPQKPSAQVSSRAVEAQFVFGRHAGAEVSAAYAILVPARRARIARSGQEGRLPDDQRGDLRQGVLGPAEERPDDRLADSGVARARHAEPA